jgi:uncharacterized membrane protein
MQGEIIVLRLAHVLGGIFWVGTALFVAVFLMPALTGAGAAAGQVMAALQRRRLFLVLPTIATLTILSGVRLMQLTSDGFSSEYFNSPGGRVYAWGGVLAIAAFAFGLVVGRPIAMRLARLAASPGGGGEDAMVAERARLQRLAAITGMVNIVLLLGAAVAMAVARYV